jgi:hypothetical protein
MADADDALALAMGRALLRLAKLQRALQFSLHAAAQRERTGSPTAEARITVTGKADGAQKLRVTALRTVATGDGTKLLGLVEGTELGALCDELGTQIRANAPTQREAARG